MKVLSAVATAFLLHCITAGTVFAGLPYPTAPSPKLTPGDLCTTPSSYRYPEHIAYCEREVPTEMKDSIIASYDRYLGYGIGSMDRQLFKIDHYIPLCMGGSNSPKNLWPQYITNYEITDKLEKLACDQMERGRLKQKDAVNIIIRAKNHLNEVPQIMRQLGSL